MTKLAILIVEAQAAVRQCLKTLLPPPPPPPPFFFFFFFFSCC